MAKKLGLVAALVLALGAALWLGQGSGTPGSTQLGALAASAQETDPATDAALPEVPEMVLGAEDAPVTLIEYASYTCPHCATFHSNVFKDLKRDYIDTGKVRFVYREVYFDRYGLWAAMVARCGGEARYFGISGTCCSTSSANGPGRTIRSRSWKACKKIGRTAGMDDATLDACLEDGAMAQAMVARSRRPPPPTRSSRTPTLIIDGQPHSNMTYPN
jgi:hypothetical protein